MNNSRRINSYGSDSANGKVLNTILKYVRDRGSNIQR